MFATSRRTSSHAKQDEVRDGRPRAGRKSGALARAPLYMLDRPAIRLGGEKGGRAAAGAQFKLTVGRPGDAYEQEADRVADQVMRAPGPRVQRSCSCGGSCPKCAAEHAEEAPGLVQTKRAEGAGTGAAPHAEVAHGSSGRPLDAGAREFMESRFGRDFGHVRVHTDGAAEESARALDARAFTLGSDVFFAAGEYRPGAEDGRRLIAHELTHVLQQQRGGDGATVHRWALGAAPAPLDWEVVTDPVHLRRLRQAEDIVRGVLTSRRCQNFFASGCRNGNANSLQDSFDAANVYLRPFDDNIFGERTGTNIAFNLRAFRIGRFMMASTLLHEIFHTCDPTAVQNTRELNSENAVEACRLHTPWIDTATPRRGAPGTRVTILGWGFGPVQGPADEVLIGNVTAPVVSWDFTTDSSSRVQIVVEVPAGAGAGGLVVINNRVASNNVPFTVL